MAHESRPHLRDLEFSSPDPQSLTVSRPHIRDLKFSTPQSPLPLPSQILEASGGVGLGMEDGGSGSGARAGASEVADAAATSHGVAYAAARKKDGNIHNVWNHGAKVGNQGFRCHYCGRSRKSGGATRLREHLGAIGGEVVQCYEVPSTVAKAMRVSEKVGEITRGETKQKKRRIDDQILEDIGGDVPNDEEGQVKLATSLSLMDFEFRQQVERRGGTFEAGSGSGSGTFVSNTNHGSSRLSTRSNDFDSDLARARASIQPRIDTSLKKGSKDKVGQAWAKWFHANDIPGIKANCPYFRAALKLTQQLGPFGEIFTGSDIDGQYLENNFEEVEVAVNQFKRDWDQFKMPPSLGLSSCSFRVFGIGKTSFGNGIERK